MRKVTTLAQARAAMRKVTTLAQARALPEIRKYEFAIRVLDADEPGVGKRGDAILTPRVRPFVPQPTAGDQILFFLDDDGRRMQVIYTVDGPAKVEFRL